MVAISRFFVLLAVLTGGNGVAIPEKPWSSRTSDQNVGGDGFSLVNTDSAIYAWQVSSPSLSTGIIAPAKQLELPWKTHLLNQKRRLNRRALHTFAKRGIKEWFKNLGKKIKDGFTKHIIEPFKKHIIEPFKKNIIEPFKKNVIEPIKKKVIPWIKKNASVIKNALIEVGTTIAGGLLEVVTGGLATPAVAVMEAASTARFVGSMVKTGVTIAKTVKAGVTAAKDSKIVKVRLSSFI
jgi:hypothetical protein